MSLIYINRIYGHGQDTQDRLKMKPYFFVWCEPNVIWPHPFLTSSIFACSKTFYISMAEGNQKELLMDYSAKTSISHIKGKLPFDDDLPLWLYELLWNIVQSFFRQNWGSYKPYKKCETKSEYIYFCQKALNLNDIKFYKSVMRCPTSDITQALKII